MVAQHTILLPTIIDIFFSVGQATKSFMHAC